MTTFNWIPREGGGSRCVVDNLGLVEVYRDAGGMCVDINGKRAWSAWRSDINGIQLDMQGRIREWEYINSFVSS